MRIPYIILSAAAACAQGNPVSDLLDGWYEFDQIVSVQPAGEKQVLLDYDTADKVIGDYSIRYRHRSVSGVERLVFSPYPENQWVLSDKARIHFWLSVDSKNPIDELNLRLELRDVEQNRSWISLEAKARQEGGSWVSYGWSLGHLNGSKGMDFSALTEIAIAGDFVDDLVVRVDGLHFRRASDSGEIVGVTSKPLQQRIAESRSSRLKRAENIYSEIVEDSESSLLSRLFAQFWIGEDLAQANAEIERIFLKERDWANEVLGFVDPWNLSATPWILRMYFTFGPGDRDTSDRLSVSSQNILLDILWDRTEGKNDIHWARNRNPWIMDGSENHDINGIVSSYLSSLIFKDHPKYMERIYPNVGKGGGPGYWFHRDRGLIRFYGPYGRANFAEADERDYVAADHYQAWGKVIRDMITARAERGFFLEQASPSYMKYTLGFLQDVYEFDTSTSMRDHVGQFLDLVWIQWAFENLHGQRGGAKTRDHTILNVEGDSMYQMARFLLGGFLTHTDLFYFLPASTYELPELVWSIALDREGLGEFALKARTIGEEPADLPRDPGLERSLNLNTEHRMFRYTWITPHSILGAQMDHPLAVHSHLSPTSRLYGINFSSHPDARIFPIGIRQTAEDDWQLIRRGGPMYRAVQHEHVLVSQQSRGYIQVNPDWFPQRSLAPVPIGVYFAPQLDSIVEKDGWIFAQAGAGFAAVRIVEAEYMAGDGIDEVTSFTEYIAAESLQEPLRENSYQWNRDRTLAVAKNAFAGLIMETSNTDRHENLNAFIEDIFKTRLDLQKTVVPGWYSLVYEGTGNAPLIEFNLSNNEVPRVDDVPLHYEPDYLFDSPFLRSKYGSGQIEVKFGGIQHPFDFKR